MILLFAGGFQSAFAQTAVFGPHLWDKPLDPEIFKKRVNQQLDAAQKSINELGRDSVATSRMILPKLHRRCSRSGCMIQRFSPPLPITFRLVSQFPPTWFDVQPGRRFWPRAVGTQATRLYQCILRSA
jgi:hypothetical protein